jgi:hypothetical protein
VSSLGVRELLRPVIAGVGAFSGRGCGELKALELDAFAAIYLLVGFCG